MTDHQALPVHGYQAQTSINVELVNKNKQIEEEVLRLLDDLLTNVHTIDRRWLAIGRTAIEQGFMAVNRSIFQPSRVKLPDDGAA